MKKKFTKTNICVCLVTEPHPENQAQGPRVCSNPGSVEKDQSVEGRARLLRLCSQPVQCPERGKEARPRQSGPTPLPL